MIKIVPQDIILPLGGGLVCVAISRPTFAFVKGGVRAEWGRSSREMGANRGDGDDDINSTLVAETKI